jgi:hypothetical protein
MMNEPKYAWESKGDEIMSEFDARIIGWSAYANGILMVANMVTLVLMFSVSMFWGTVNDAISVVWILSFLPLAALLARVNGPVMGRGLAVGIAVAGVVTMLLFAWLQSLLVLGQVRFEQTLATVMTLGGVLGLWLLLNGLLALKGKTLPGGLVWLSIGYGFTYVLAALSFWMGGYEQPILWIGAGLGFLIGPVWAFWLGWLLLHGRLAPVAAVASGG